MAGCILRRQWPQHIPAGGEAEREGASHVCSWPNKNIFWSFLLSSSRMIAAGRKAAGDKGRGRWIPADNKQKTKKWKKSGAAGIRLVKKRVAENGQRMEERALVSLSSSLSAGFVVSRMATLRPLVLHLNETTTEEKRIDRRAGGNQPSVASRCIGTDAEPPPPFLLSALLLFFPTLSTLRPTRAPTSPASARCLRRDDGHVTRAAEDVQQRPSKTLDSAAKAPPPAARFGRVAVHLLPTAGRFVQIIGA